MSDSPEPTTKYSVTASVIGPDLNHEPPLIYPYSFDHAASVEKAISADSEALQGDDNITVLTGGISGTIDPPYDPATLYHNFERSNALRQNIDAYATNIDGFGHRYDAVIDFDADNIDDLIREALKLEREHLPAILGVDPDDGADTQVGEVRDEDIAERKALLKRQARRELARLKLFFKSCCVRDSFISLRRLTRQDLEVTGNAYWEVLRDQSGRVAQLERVAPIHMRLRVAHTAAVEITRHITIEEGMLPHAVTRRVRFRSFVQTMTGRNVFFKQFGDPRLMSKTNGEFYDSLDALREAESNPRATSASEIIHFKIPAGNSPYGAPRWIGQLLGVRGSQSAERVNQMYFDNKSIPPLALLVSGGNLSAASKNTITDFVRQNIKGEDNFHKILIVEATSSQPEEVGATAPQNPLKIEFKSLKEALQEDALFQEYDQRVQDKLGQSFRIARLLRGDTRDFNKATAQAALRFAEEQVFQPERNELDAQIERTLFEDMGIHLWRFRSLAPETRDPERMTAMVEKLVEKGVLTPNEGRQLAGDIFNREFPPIEAIWANQPLALSVKGIVLDEPATNAEDTDEDTDDTDEDEISPARADEEDDIDLDAKD